jgi:hypothetical protein
MNAFRIAADLVILLHLTFVAFVVLGGLLVARWPRLMWAHIPAAIWGTVVEYSGWICPLTPLENELGYRAGLARYEGDFVEHYLLPLLYPAHLTRTTQVVLGTIVVAVNIAAYAVAFRARRR